MSSERIAETKLFYRDSWNLLRNQAYRRSDQSNYGSILSAGKEVHKGINRSKDEAIAGQFVSLKGADVRDSPADSEGERVDALVEDPADANNATGRERHSRSRVKVKSGPRLVPDPKLTELEEEIIWCNGRCNGRANTAGCTLICLSEWEQKLQIASHQLVVRQLIEKHQYVFYQSYE